MAGRFEELLLSLMEPGEDGPPETIYDDLSAEYNSVLESAAAKVTEHESAVQALNAEISRLKAQNFDLLMSVGAQPVENETEDGPGEDDTPGGIDSLFEN